MRIIQGLLAKAESTTFEDERAKLIAKADDLMMKHRIELWEIQQHHSGRISEREPVIRDFDYKFAFESGDFSEISDALWSLFLSTARYCGCLVVFHKQHYSGERKEYASYTVPVIGTESDLGWFSLLFSSLMTQLVDQIRPKYDPNKDYYQNLRMFKEAGWSWPETGAVMQQAGFHTDVSAKLATDMCIRAYRKWCKQTGVDQNYSNWKTYRRNFGAGFASAISRRLSDMQGQAVKEAGGGMEIALRDQAEINRDFMLSEFPVPASSGKKYALTKDNRKFDSAAYGGGQSAGAKANIQGSPGSGVKGASKKQIGS